MFKNIHFISTGLKYIGRHCIRIDKAYSKHNPSSKQYSEESTNRCMDACKDNLVCTGGHHWHRGKVCYHFGVEGAIYKESTYEYTDDPSTGFVCSGMPGKNPYISKEAYFASKINFFNE